MDLEACGAKLSSGKSCSRRGSKPDGRCHQHCAPEYRIRASPIQEKEFEDNLVQRMRSMLISNLRESEERMSKILSAARQEIDNLKVNNLAQERLLSFYESIIREKVPPGELESYLPEIPKGEELEKHMRSIALTEAGFTEEEYDKICEKEPVKPLSLVLVSEEGEDQELSFEEKEKLYSKLYSESLQHSEDGVLPPGFMERYKLLFPKERRKNLFTVSELIPPSPERDLELLAYYERKKEKGLIKKVPCLEDIPGSTKYKPYVQREVAKQEEQEQNFPEWVEKFTRSALEGQSTPCVHCKVGLAPPERVSCNDCYIKLWQCKALGSKGQPCQSFASQNGPYCKRHLGYRPKTDKK